MLSVLKPVLEKINSHKRDADIQFIEEGHKYIIIPDPTNKYTSVTTWNHSHFPEFDADKIIKSMMKGRGWKDGHKYWGLSPEAIKLQWSTNAANVSGAGTDLHYEIECFMNECELDPGYSHKELYEHYLANTKPCERESKPLEWEYFIHFIRDTPNLKPYRTEWIIYHEDVKIAGSIDMLYENPDGSLSIYDWKRSKEITKVNMWDKFANTQSISQMPDSNFWHYALQLNTYKTILEAKYDKIVKDLYLVRLHPNAVEKTYELLKVPDLSSDITELFDQRLKQIK